MKGKAETVENNGHFINNQIPLPAVIRLLNYVVVPYSVIPLNRKNVLHRDAYTCQYCAKKASTLTVDHIIPKSRGGKNSWDNVVAACLRCNNKKANRTPREADMNLIKQPTMPSNRLRFELTKNYNLHNGWDKYLEA